MSHDRAAIAVGAAFLLLYRLTAAPGLLFADSGELQTVAMAGGIPHATGYPLWVALAHAFTWLPFGAPEFRVTLFSAVCGAAALGLLVRRLGEMGVGLAASVTAACFLGVTFSFWRVSVRAEVYTLSALVALIAFGAVLGAVRGQGALAAGGRGAPPAATSSRVATASAPAAPSRGPLLRAAFLVGIALLVHLSFAPVVAVAGLALAWHAWRAAPGDLPRLPLVLGAFLLGLTPYLLLVALDASGVRANYLDLVREAGALLGIAEPPIESPWQGVWWLVTGRNVHPPQPMGFHPRSILAMFPNAAAVLFLFELGPVGLLLMLLGLARRGRRDRGLALGLAAAFITSLGFTAWLQFGPMLHLFILPAILIGAILVADGIDGVIGWAAGVRRSSARIPVAALILWAALALPPAILRAHAEERPIGAGGWRVVEEDPEFRAGFVPGMQRDRGAETWARAALEAFPRDALVLARWTHYTPLRHLQELEGRRADLTLRQISIPTLAPRLRRWQEAHDLASAPIVFAAADARLAPYLGGADSIALPGGRFACVIRRPLADILIDPVPADIR
ncbi:MAG: DUF2723 domain-containing protein [Candidatus Eisenbacteria bacterium]